MVEEKQRAQVRLRLITYNARLIDCRKKMGLKQRELANYLGVSVTTVGHVETLRIIPSENIMDEFASFFNVDRDYLFPDELIEAMREGVFDQRVVDLQEKHLVRLTEARMEGLLPQGITEEEAIDAMDRELFLKKGLSEVLKTLTPREQRVLELRFGLEDGRSRTLEEVGKEFNVGRGRIQQIEAKALRRLRHPSRSRRLKDYL